METVSGGAAPSHPAVALTSIDSQRINKTFFHVFLCVKKADNKNWKSVNKTRWSLTSEKNWFVDQECDDLKSVLETKLLNAKMLLIQLKLLYCHILYLKLSFQHSDHVNLYEALFWNLYTQKKYNKYIEITH